MKLNGKRVLQLKKAKTGVFLLCTIISGCTKKSTSRSNVFVVNQQEAKLVDVPIPLYDERLSVEVSDSNRQDNTILGYRSSLTVTAIIDFYVHEMERLGWRQLALFQGTESLVQFESPERLCSISIRPSDIQLRQAHTDVVIFVGRKQVSTTIS